MTADLGAKLILRGFPAAIVTAETIDDVIAAIRYARAPAAAQRLSALRARYDPSGMFVSFLD